MVINIKVLIFWNYISYHAEQVCFQYISKSMHIMEADTIYSSKGHITVSTLSYYFHLNHDTVCTPLYITMTS